MNESCHLCGGPHLYDTSIDSETWNRVIRDRGLPEYLCCSCIVAAFAAAREGFTARLWAEDFTGATIEVRILPRSTP